MVYSEMSDLDEVDYEGSVEPKNGKTSKAVAQGVQGKNLKMGKGVAKAVRPPKNQHFPSHAPSWAIGGLSLLVECGHNTRDEISHCQLYQLACAVVRR